MFYGPADAIGDYQANQDENDINRDQFHLAAPINPRGLSIRRMQAGGEGMAARKML